VVDSYIRAKIAIRRGVKENPDVMFLRGKEIVYRLTTQSGGVFNLGIVTAGDNKQETPYIFTWGYADFRRGDKFFRRGKWYQIDNVSRTDLFGGIIQTQALVTEIFYDPRAESTSN
jgi:hypothetical protein